MLESQVHKIVIREIILEEFQRMWSQSTNVTDGWTDSQTTVTTYHGNTELHYASRGKNAKITVLIITQFQLHTIGAESMEGGGDEGDRPHSQKVVGAMPSSRPHRYFVTSFWNSKMYIKNMNLLLCQWQKLRRL